MFGKMKDELIALYYSTTQEFEVNTYSKNIK